MTLREKSLQTTRVVLGKSAEVVASLPSRTREAIELGRDTTRGLGARASAAVEYPLGSFEALATLSARRLKAAADAESFDAFLAGQKAINPETRAVLQAEAKKYLELWFEAKEAVDAKLKAQVMGLVTPKARARKPRAVETAPAAA